MAGIVAAVTGTHHSATAAPHHTPAAGAATASAQATGSGPAPASASCPWNEPAQSSRPRADLGGTTVTYHAGARGQSKPVAANSTASGRQLNRRVVITTP